MCARVARLLVQALALVAAIHAVSCKLFRELLSDASGAAGKVIILILLIIPHGPVRKPFSSRRIPALFFLTD